MSDLVARARNLVGRAERIVVLTGAGVSAESGVPTFRGAGGLRRRHRPEELATPEAFARDPRLVWEWYAWRRELVITQNVDGLHNRAAALAAGVDRDPSPAHPLEIRTSSGLERRSTPSCWTPRSTRHRGPTSAWSSARAHSFIRRPACPRSRSGTAVP